MSTKAPSDQINYKDPKACEDLKILHDKCFHKWLREKFLPGLAKEDDCKSEWQAYEQCIEKKLAAFDLSHLKRSKGEQLPISIDIELTPDLPKSENTPKK